MVPINVAVVPYDDTAIREPDAQNDLTRVTAALQIQVTRDFAPIWGVSANVTPFLSLEHVPVGYMALVLAARVHMRTHGVHFATGGRPFALVKYENLEHPGNWSVTASHELLEMLSDPWGSRVIAGRALEGDVNSEVRQVEYLLEVCDPCQRYTYLIDGVLVSDFLTPDYYSPKCTKGLRYSFTGKIGKPRTVPEGGYISWRIPGSDTIWQQHGPLTAENPPTELRRFSLLSALSLRESVDSKDGATQSAAPALYDEDFPDRETMEKAEKAYADSRVAAQKYGRALRRDIGNMIPPDVRSEPSLTLLDIFEALGGAEFHAEYLKDPRGAIEQLVRGMGRPLDGDIDVERDIPEAAGPDMAPPEVFAWHAKQMRKTPADGDLGDPMFLPGGALWWLAALGGG
jgi:hypothetical protein